MSNESLDQRFASAQKMLSSYKQEHLLKFYPTLSQEGKTALLDQLDSIDWPELARLIQTHALCKPEFTLPENVLPAPWYPNVAPEELKGKYKEAKALGLSLLEEGKVAAFTVAGGQGTRLGWDAPKGTFPSTPIRGFSLFQSMAEFLLKAGEKYGHVIPWYIMTSPINHADTKAYFEKNDYLGLGRKNVSMFPQAMMPAVCARTGRVLLETHGTLALSPNGHGGSLKALYTSGAIEDMKRRGIEQISYTQVDNPIVKMVDPQFIGLHALDGCQMSSKMLPKREPLEKLGNFCVVDGKMTVIEYSDLPEKLARETLVNGELRFKAGSIALHAIRVDFVEWLNTRDTGFALPFHRADKKVGHVAHETGEKVAPEKPNAVKLETFVFDALPMCQKSIIYETDRIEEFAPIKNADAAPGQALVPDSPASSKLLQSVRAARWLERAGVKVARKADGAVDAVIEISQRNAIGADDLEGIKLPASIESGAKVLL